MFKKNKTLVTMLMFGLVVLGVAYGVYTLQDGRGVLRQLGSVVGMYASTEPNEHNVIAQQLKERAEELDEKEAALERQQQEIVERAVARDKTSVVFIAAIGLLLLILVSMNFYFDWRRRG